MTACPRDGTAFITHILSLIHISTGVMNGLPIPALCNAISYLDEFCGKAVGANLIQAQRDCFGAHTYERTDREGTFHHEWRKANDN